jgi:hypothetical protein
MGEILRTRIIPSIRTVAPKKFSVRTSAVTADDVLLLHIKHESKPFNESYVFDGEKIDGKKTIHFHVEEKGKNVTIIWDDVEPEGRLVITWIPEEPTSEPTAVKKGKK